MNLQGNQIYLKENLSEENYPLLLKWLTDLEIIGYVYSAKRMVKFKTIEDAKDFLAEEKDEIFWEIYTKDGKFIGYTSLCSFQGKEQCEFNIFILDKNYWGKGVGLEATKMMLDYAFNELGMKKVVLETSEFHQGAIRLYEKAGFKKVEIVPNDRTVFHNDEWILSGSLMMETINNKKIIDSHVHISIYNNNAKSLNEVFDLLLSEMKKNGIGFAIVIPDNIESSDSIADLNKAIELIGKRKNLFLLGSPQIIQRGSSELKKYKKLLEEEKIKGLKFFPGHDPYYPTDKRCLSYYKLCQDFDVPVLFHTGENSGDSECAKWNDPKYIVEIAKKYPKLKVIITHYYWPKLDYCYEITRDVPNIYFELAALADAEVIEKSGGIEKIREILLKTISERPDNIIFGTDWPMCKIEEHIELVNSLSLNKEIEESIFSRNAERTYKLI